MPINNLGAIRTKIRRLTRSPSTVQIADAELDNYINTFLLYDLPEHLRTFNLRTTFSFYTNPFQDEYPTDVFSFGTNPAAQKNPLYDFQNLYLTIHPPIYIAGFQSFYSQSREQFFGIYPFVNSIASIGTAGDGIATTFTGVVNATGAIVPAGLTQNVCLLKRQVLFSSVDSNGVGLALVDVPLIDPTTGNQAVVGNLFVPNNLPTVIQNYPADIDPNNNINYVTGAFTITFTTAPGAGIAINSQTVPSTVSLPQAIVYYDNKFVVRPVPDQPYKINFETYKRPTELLATGQIPELQEWWQYIAYGGAKKLLEDKMDLDTVNMILPEFRKQENLVLRRTIVQNTNERTSTIYTEQTSMQGSGWGWGFGGPF